MILGQSADCDIILYCQAGKNSNLLKCSRYPQSYHITGLCRCNRTLANLDVSRLQRYKPGNSIEKSGFTRTIRTNYSAKLTNLHFETYRVECDKAIKRDRDVSYL